MTNKDSVNKYIHEKVMGECPHLKNHHYQKKQYYICNDCEEVFIKGRYFDYHTPQGFFKIWEKLKDTREELKEEQIERIKKKNKIDDIDFIKVHFTETLLTKFLKGKVDNPYWALSTNAISGMVDYTTFPTLVKEFMEGRDD